jgi:hypothetical protein
MQEERAATERKINRLEEDLRTTQLVERSLLDQNEQTKQYVIFVHVCSPARSTHDVASLGRYGGHVFLNKFPSLTITLLVRHLKAQI